MAHKVIVRILGGFSCAAMLTFAFLTVRMLNDGEAVVAIKDLWMNMAGSMLFGAYFGVASFLFERDRWSPLKQLVVHFLLSITLFFPVAVAAGWIPFTFKSLLLGLGMFIGVYLCFWLGLGYYFRKQAAALNDTVQSKR